MKSVISVSLIFGIILAVTASASAASFAGSVISYDAGSAPATEWPSFLPYTDPTAALGMPQGVTSDADPYGASLLSPFSAADQLDEIVSIGEGGHLTLKMENYINVGAGLDIGVIGNTALMDSAWPAGVAGTPATPFGNDPATVDVSADGTNWVALGEVMFDMPANYYANATGYNVAPPASPVVADFGKPFGPAGGLAAFDGLNFAAILTLLDGSGGGTWLDLSGTGLSQVGYIRFSVADDGDAGTSLNFELDAVLIANGKVGGAVGDEPVPEPAAISLFAIASGLGLIRRRRR